MIRMLNKQQQKITNNSYRRTVSLKFLEYHKKVIFCPGHAACNAFVDPLLVEESNHISYTGEADQEEKVTAR